MGNRVRRVTADTEECYKYDAENRMTAYIKMEELSFFDMIIKEICWQITMQNIHTMDGIS